MTENTAGSGSGLKHAKTYNFGFMAGVRQLRDEEYQDQYKPLLKPPGSSNFLRIAQEQFNMEDQGEGHSGYMAEEPGNTPAWRRVPQHLVKLRLPTLLYDGTAKDDPNDSYENGITGQWSSKMRAKGQMGDRILPGYDGAVVGGYEGEETETTLEVSVGVEKARAREVSKARGIEKLGKMLAKSETGRSETSSDPKAFRQALSQAHTTGQDPSAGSAGWEVGSENQRNLATLKRALMGWSEEAKSSRKPPSGGAAK